MTAHRMILAALLSWRCAWGFPLQRARSLRAVARPASSRALASAGAFDAAAGDAPARRWGLVARCSTALREGRRRAGRPQAVPGQRRRLARRAAAVVAALLVGAAATGASAASPLAQPARLAALASTTVLEGIRASPLLAAGVRRDSLALLIATAAVVPVFKRLGVSPILGFLASGVVLGPNALGVISDLHTTEALAELGVVFFLFEMGLELSLERLKSMRKEIFGLGLLQLVTTASLICGVCAAIPGLMPLLGGAPGTVVVGTALALSSSAFVLQLLKDGDELSSRSGRAALGVLLLQDLAVVPLLIVIPLLARLANPTTVAASAAVVAAAAPWYAPFKLVGVAASKVIVGCAAAELVGKRLLDTMFYFAAKSRSQEAFLSVVLLTVIGMSAITESIGLSGTLGAFLAGISLSETRYRYQVEADVAPFRGMLLGLFFVTVGFSIDLRFVAARPLLVAKVVTALITLKAGTLTALSLALGIPAAASVRVGLLLAQSGEFAFVAFGLANKLRILDPLTTKVLLTASAISMAATPALSVAGTAIADRIERAQRRRGVDISLRDDKSVVMDSDAAVVVCGYGRVGKVVCELLEAKLQKYVVFDVDPKKATNARAAKKPVFFGDLSRPEVLEYFHVGSARLIVVAISEKSAANKVVVTLRRLYPNVEIIVRAADKEHQRRLNSMLKVVAMVPSLPEDSRLLSLPFAGAVLRALDYTADDVDMLLEDSRKSSLGLFEGSTRTLVVEEQAALLEQLGIKAPEPEPEQREGDAAAAAPPPSSEIFNKTK